MDDDTQPADVIYGVKVAGRDTITFPAIKDPAPEPCRCGLPGCPDGPPVPRPTDTRFVLAYGPGVVTRMWRTRIQNGQWEDIDAAADAAAAEVFTPTLQKWRRILNDLEVGWHAMAAIFRADPRVIAPDGSPQLARGLADYAAVLEAGLYRVRADDR